MENDPVNKSNEEEYQFVDSEQSAGFAPPSSTRPSMPVKETGEGGSKKIFVIIGIVAAVFCLYKLYGVFSATPEKPKTEMPAPMETIKQKPVTPQTEVQKPMVAAGNAAPVVAPAESAVSQQVSTVANKVGNLERVVSQVSQSNANLQDQMAGVATAIAEIRNNVSSLSDQMTTLAKEKEKTVVVKKLKKTEMKPIKKIVSTKKTFKPTVESKPQEKPTASVQRSTYSIKAMIQGRAWLMTSEGATLTIAEGDNLPGYGQVTTIDPVAGEVTTSSGTIIGYRTDDR